MKKYLMKGFAVLTTGLAMISCTQEINYEVQEQQASIDNAQQTLGFYIPANQDWVMTSTANATFSVKGIDDTSDTVYVFSNNPIADGYGEVLASAPLTGASTSISNFRIPQHLKMVYVGLKESDGNMVYKYVDVEDGQITASYDFSATPAEARTRANAVINGDPFTFENTSTYYKSTLADVPNNARDINATSDWDCLQSGKLFAIRDIRSDLNLWSGSVDIYIYGNVTLPSSAYIASANIYVLSGSTLTMNKQANNVCRVFVAPNATLNYNLSALETNGGSGHSAIYNRGTVHLPANFQANNDAIVYNEGSVTGGDITSAPGSNNPSFFYNFGTLELSGNLQLNSCANFYNEGTVTVGGITQCTQGSAQVWWINKGHYTTRRFGIMAWNGTFYNYCQLFIQEDASLHDGQLNLMPNGYMEAATAEFGNFQINMYGNTGMNIKGNNHWIAQGDSYYQGFKAYADNNYVRLGGTTYVDQHHNTLVAEGKLYIGFYNLYAPNSDNPYDGPYIDLRENVKKVQFGKLNPTYSATDCGANWGGSTPPISETPTENQTWTYAFEDNKTRCDFDLNDVVIQVKQNSSNANKLDVTLVAAGCEYDNYVYLGDQRITWAIGAEVHAAFGTVSRIMVNTGRGMDATPVTTTIDKPANFDFQNADFKIRPFKFGANPDDLTQSVVSDYIGIVKEGNPSGLPQAPLGIAIPAKWKWPKERTNVTNAYEGFAAWGTSTDLSLKANAGGWYQYPSSGLIYGN